MLIGNPRTAPTYPTAKRLEEMRAEETDLDVWHKRLLAAGWPRPAPPGPIPGVLHVLCGPKVSGVSARRHPCRETRARAACAGHSRSRVARTAGATPAAWPAVCRIRHTDSVCGLLHLLGSLLVATETP